MCRIGSQLSGIIFKYKGVLLPETMLEGLIGKSIVIKNYGKSPLSYTELPRQHRS